ncbi:MAG: 3,4-dihydroxy-2-butanone-4-phosphate synthase [Bacteroidetes bacterium]|nr:3,4-dihydroxy-2-butanone-4-phosphate synthase [Bacteroidota bacterium]
MEDALAALRAGKVIIVVDDEDRENEGDFVVAAEHITPEIVNLFATEGRGLICAPMSGERATALRLDAMVPVGDALHGTAFTVSVDAAHGVTTGISASDRAHTLRLLANASSRPDDLVRPGHVFPLLAHPAGVLVRKGHTEATVDLMQLAGLAPVGVLVEILNEDGSMARRPDLARLRERYGMPMISVAQVVHHRLMQESTVEEVVRVQLPSTLGRFDLVAFEMRWSKEVHLALIKGDLAGLQAAGTPVLTRIHSQCVTGDIFGSSRCDCGEQLARAMEAVESAGAGVILYLKQEGRGIGLINKLRAYKLQEEGLDTVEANEALGFEPDERNYAVAAHMLKALGVDTVELISNNPQKREGLEEYGVSVHTTRSIHIPANPSNLRYLETKRDRMGHLLGHLLDRH